MFPPLLPPAAMCKVLPDFNLAISLFHFLQLLCEGHNLSFQNYLRTQAGNTTTVNIIVCTVDYLLRLQDSISDFYWHYSDYDTIDISGRENLLKAFKVAKQVFRTLTEYIQVRTPRLGRLDRDIACVRELGHDSVCSGQHVVFFLSMCWLPDQDTQIRTQRSGHTHTYSRRLGH